MPLLIITLVGLLVFGLFDLTLGRPLPVGSQAVIRQEIDVDPQPGEPEPTPLEPLRPSKSNDARLPKSVPNDHSVSFYC